MIEYEIECSAAGFSTRIPIYDRKHAASRYFRLHKYFLLL